MEPVWLPAAATPSSVLPPLRTTTGFSGVILLTASSSLLPSRTPSVYIATTRVSGSEPRYSRTSTSSTSALLPRHATRASPNCWLEPSQRAYPAAKRPVCATMDMPPGLIRSSVRSEVTNPDSVLMVPTLFGPTTRTPRLAAVCRSSSWSRAPSPPESAKPAAVTITRLTFEDAHSSTNPAMRSRGITATATSIFSRTADIDGYARSPIISSAPWCIG